MFVAVTCINVLYLKIHSRRHIRERPELAAGYQRLVRGGARLPVAGQGSDTPSCRVAVFPLERRLAALLLGSWSAPGSRRYAR